MNITDRPTPEMDAASEVDAIRREHAAIAASYESQRDTMSGSGLPYGPCQCSVCAEGITDRPAPETDAHMAENAADDIETVLRDILISP